MPKLLIFDVFTLLIHKKNVANYAVMHFCGVKRLAQKYGCENFDKYHVWGRWGGNEHNHRGLDLKKHNNDGAERSLESRWWDDDDGGDGDGGKV